MILIYQILLQIMIKLMRYLEMKDQIKQILFMDLIKKEK